MQYCGMKNLNKIRVLYIHNSPVLGGSSRSLALLYKYLKKKGVEATVFTSAGPVENFFRKAGLKIVKIRRISQFDNTKYSHYRGIRWVVLLRELFFLPASLYYLFKILKEEKFHLVHINEAPLFIYAPFIKKFFKLPVVLHIRSPQNKIGNLRNKIIEYIFRKYIDVIIAIDKTVKESLPDLSEKIKIVYNGFEKPGYFERIPSEFFRIGFIGILYKAKGIYEILQALKILVKERGIKNIKLVVAGDNPRQIKNIFLKFILKISGFYQDTKNYMLEFVKKENLQNNFEYLGFLEDVSLFYKKIDLLLFPSHLNAPGRPVIEAGFYGVPSIVALSNPYSDILIPEETGIVIDRPSAFVLSQTVERLYRNPEIVKKRGENARLHSEKYFDIEKNAEKVLEIYKSVIDKKA